jgi:hypothetical protein
MGAFTVQVYILDRDPKRAAELLAEWPARARCANMREGQQLLSVGLAQRGLPTLIKRDGSRYGEHNHEHSRLTRWFCARENRFAWLFDHVSVVTYLYYREHFDRLMLWCESDLRGFRFARPYLDERPWYPDKRYEGPVGDVEAYLTWKYGGKV